MNYGIILNDILRMYGYIKIEDTKVECLKNVIKKISYENFSSFETTEITKINENVKLLLYIYPLLLSMLSKEVIECL